MKVTERTRKVLSYRRTIRDLKRDGFEEVGEGGGKLWQIYRGGRQGQKIRDVRIAPDGMSLFVKIA